MNIKSKKRIDLKPIPKFKSLLEEAEFWDSHDLTEYFDFSKGKWGKFELIGKHKKETSLTFRLQKDLKNKLDNLARKLGLSASTLVRMWAMEKLQTI